MKEELELKRLRNKFSDAIFISALRHLRLDDVRDHIIDKIESDFEKFWLEIDSFPNQITTKSTKGFLKNLKKKL